MRLLYGISDSDMKEFEHNKKLKQSGNYIEFVEEFQSTAPLNCGYPSDDTLALQQIASGGDYEYWHGSPFVSNEEMIISSYLLTSVSNCTTYLAGHEHILAGTITGVIDFGEHDKCSFVVNSNGAFHFNKLGENPVYDLIYDAYLNLTTGELTLKWKGVQEPKVIISYEYNLEV